MGNPGDEWALANASLGSDTDPYRKTITNADSSITLPSGGYMLHLEGTIPAIIKIGGVAVVPATGGSGTAGGYLAPGVYVPLSLPQGGDLHAILTSAGSSELWATRVR